MIPCAAASPNPEIAVKGILSAPFSIIKRLEPGAEHDSVEVFGAAVGEGHRRSRDGLDPRAHRDSALGDQRQVLLVEGDAGGEQRRIRRRRAVLLRAAAGLDHDLLELPVDLRPRQGLVGEGAVPREDPVVRRDPGGELRQDVALSPLGDHDAAAPSWASSVAISSALTAQPATRTRLPR